VIEESYITRFSQPDSIVPDPYNPQSLNRYSYVLNNPIRYNDPTGHSACDQIPAGPARKACQSGNYGVTEEAIDALKGRPGSNPCAAFGEVTRAICDRGAETKTPTYNTLTVGGPIGPWTNLHVSITRDAYQQWYVGAGWDWGPSPINLSLVSGFIKEQDLPRDPQKRPEFVRNVFMSGWSQQPSVAPMLYFGKNTPTNADSPIIFADEYGLAVPEAGLAVTYTWPIGNPNE
jgi:hypothetical protein